MHFVSQHYVLTELMQSLKRSVELQHQGFTMCRILQDMPFSQPHKRPSASFEVPTTDMNTGASSNVKRGKPVASLKAQDALASQPQSRPSSSLLVLLASRAAEHAGASCHVSKGASSHFVESSCSATLALIAVALAAARSLLVLVASSLVVGSLVVLAVYHCASAG
jgi:hypothetical protein